MSLCAAIRLLPENSYFRKGGNIWLVRPFLMILLKGGQYEKVIQSLARATCKPPPSRDFARRLLEMLLRELILVRDPNNPQLIHLSPMGSEIARELRAHNQPDTEGGGS